MGTKTTLPHKIQAWAEKTPNRIALRALNASGGWDDTLWGEYWQTVRAVAKGLLALGHQKGEAVALVGNNRKEWVFSQFATMANGGMPAPIYTTNTMEQVAYIVRHSGANIAVCDNQTQLDKYLDAKKQGLITCEHIVVFDDVPVTPEGVLTLAQLIEKGKAVDDATLDARLDGLLDTDIGLLIYTSGTTGVPKGAEYTHANMHAMSTMFETAYPAMFTQEDFRYVSYLPLCHAAEQTFTNFCAIHAGGQVHFCPEISMIKDVLLQAHPSIFFAVPRVWEKFQAALEGKFAVATGFKAKLIAWARKTELAAFEKSVRTGQDVNTFARRMAKKLVLTKVTDALGLDQLMVAGSGSAPIARSSLDFFASLGIPIHEGFGMTETTGVATVQPMGRPRFGTIGVAMDGVQIMIGGDGEILLKGPNMISGYMGMPEQSRELYNEAGWMHTGDLGELDPDGYLKITGRKKELLITAGGKNVAPAEMEAHLKSIPGVGQAVVVGDRQPYLCALLVLDEEALPDLCKAAGVADGGTIADYAGNSVVIDFLEKRIETDCNAKVARYQTIKKFKVVPHAFTVETDELTPTMKVRRNVVNEKYAHLIDSMYDKNKPVATAAS